MTKHDRPLEGNQWLCSYLYDDSERPWSYSNPRNAAVQIEAAITAHALIHMHPFISREDCVYTDTDSVVLSSPLPDEFISSNEIGKLKLEYVMPEGIFNAPKSYCLITDGDHSDSDIMVHKGGARSHVTREWYT